MALPGEAHWEAILLCAEVKVLSLAVVKSAAPEADVPLPVLVPVPVPEFCITFCIICIIIDIIFIIICIAAVLVMDVPVLVWSWFGVFVFLVQPAFKVLKLVVSKVGW